MRMPSLPTGAQLHYGWSMGSGEYVMQDAHHVRVTPTHMGFARTIAAAT